MLSLLLLLFFATFLYHVPLVPTAQMYTFQQQLTAHLLAFMKLETFKR
jgi:hypothetical protein